MRYTKTACGLAAALLLGCAASSADAALATRTWVAKTTLAPDDMNPCSRTAPCLTFAGALAKTEEGGEISVLDPGGYGAVTITKSITINGTPGAGYGSILASEDSNGIVIALAPTDKLLTVRLNWLDINGLSTGLHGIRIAANQPAGVSVVIENSTIDGFKEHGILDERLANGKLTVANTVVRHIGGSGIALAGNNKSKLQATLANVRVHNSAWAGLVVGPGAKAAVSNSVFSGNYVGVYCIEGGSALVDGSTMSGNFSGAGHDGSGMLAVSNSDLSFNDWGATGPVQSFTNNRFTGNVADGQITPIGQPTSATGLR